jgi:hypothetical protein
MAITRSTADESAGSAAAAVCPDEDVEPELGTWRISLQHFRPRARLCAGLE